MRNMEKLTMSMIAVVAATVFSLPTVMSVGTVQDIILLTIATIIIAISAVLILGIK